MKQSIKIYDGDKLIMELIAVETNGVTEYYIKKENCMRMISCERFNTYIDIAKYAGYTCVDNN